MNFDLTTTGTEQPPAFNSVESCREWLAGLPATNAAQTQSLLLNQLVLLHRFSLPETTRYTIIETLLAPVCEAQEDTLKKFVGRALPLAPPEQAALDGALAIWHAMAQGYLRCFEACRAGDSSHDAKTAAIGQRIFALFADWQVTLYRGNQLPEPGYWKELHRVFAILEQKKLLLTAVHDPVRLGSTPTRPLAAYAECHLLHSSHPYELPTRHLTWVARWARRWSIKVELLTAPPEDIRNRAMPLWFDLESDQATSYSPRPSPGGRWLETTELRKSIAARIGLLEQGRSPVDLQLGDDVTQPTAGQILNRLLTRWCKGGLPRRPGGQPAAGDCQLVTGMAAAHVHFSGSTAVDGSLRDDATLRREQEQYLMFGTRGHHAAKTTALTGAPIEKWKVADDWRLLDETTLGLRITRPLKDGARIAAGTLVAIKLPAAGDFVLGNARWVLRENSQTLALGIQILQGAPRFISLRPTDTPGSSALKPGFLLPAAQEAASILAPVGSFRIGRELEVRVADQTLIIKLAQLLDRGSDFERCTYQLN